MALKIGVVGMGGIGNTHAGCHRSDDLAQLVAVCDVVKEKADAAAERHGVKAYYSLEDMLANEDLDVVDVTTGGYENGSWHFEPAMEALAAGKHVLCEKPLSNDIGEAREMVALRRASKRLYLGCNLNHYFTADGRAREAVHGRRRRSARRSTCCSRWASTAARRPTGSTSRRASTSPTRT